MAVMQSKALRATASTSIGRDEIWVSIRTLKTFTVNELARHSGGDRKTVRDYLACLHKGEVLSKDGTSFTLLRDMGVHAPRYNRQGKPVTQGRGVENMWRSMRLLEQFTSRDIAVHSNTPDVQVSEETAKSYCTMLMRCGYLRVVQKARPSVGQLAIYRLIRNTGPLPPQVQRIKQVFDPNTGDSHGPGGAE